MTTRSILLTILNILSSMVGIIIGARIIFLLVGANPSTPIVTWINNVSSALIYPFIGLFQNIALSSQSVIDVTAIVALIVYAIVFSLAHRLISMTTHDEYVAEAHSHV